MIEIFIGVVIGFLIGAWSAWTFGLNEARCQCVLDMLKESPEPMYGLDLVKQSNGLLPARHGLRAARAHGGSRPRQDAAARRRWEDPLRSFAEWRSFMNDTNVGLGMVQDTPEEKEIARLERRVRELERDLVVAQGLEQMAMEQRDKAWATRPEELPNEPTPEMIEAGTKAYWEKLRGPDTHDMRAAYKAMVKAWRSPQLIPPEKP